MQFDMHYYGTYTMAAAAGIPKSDAETIATAAQFVDDQNFEHWAIAKSGEGILGIATAHHPLDAGVRTFLHNGDSDDSRAVWVPFHFLPGNEGTNFEDRLVARKDSPVVNAMLDYYLEPSTIESHASHILHLIGIAAHVYADTFSHYGFSGISSDNNVIKPESLRPDESHSDVILQHLIAQADRFKAIFTSTPKLGHGAVLTHPDRPYLKWSFEYQNGQTSRRNNPDTFVEACKALHTRFIQFSGLHYKEAAQAPIPWTSIQDAVTDIIKREGTGDERAQFWIDSVNAGQFSGVTSPKKYDAGEWSSEIVRFKADGMSDGFIQSNAYKFFSAADYHRGYVLKRLLPRFGLLVA